MQAKPGIIDWLNTVLTIELTAVNQYFLQSEMVRNWGYERLGDKLRDLSMGEMKDSQELVRHILFLEGLPNMQRLNDVRIGENVVEDLNLDLEGERNIVDVLNQAIVHCADVQDFGTRGLFEEMVRDEQQHVDWFETQLEAIRQVGMENYLSQQLHS